MILHMISRSWTNRVVLCSSTDFSVRTHSVQFSQSLHCLPQRTPHPTPTPTPTPCAPFFFFLQFIHTILFSLKNISSDHHWSWILLKKKKFHPSLLCRSRAALWLSSRAANAYCGHVTLKQNCRVVWHWMVNPARGGGRANGSVSFSLQPLLLLFLPFSSYCNCSSFQSVQSLTILCPCGS